MNHDLGVAGRDARETRAAGSGAQTPWLRFYGLELAIGWVPPFVVAHLRTSLLRATGVQIGQNTLFWQLPTLLGSGPIHRRLKIGKGCGFNKGAVFDLAAPIHVGDNVDVGHDVMFVTSGRARPDGVARADETEPKPIVIGNGVWLGARSTVLSGVTIGAGSVVGAGVTVAADVAQNTLLTGAAAISLARWRSKQ
jgi:maltose O-acetyltransferase